MVKLYRKAVQPQSSYSYPLSGSGLAHIHTLQEGLPSCTATGSFRQQSAIGSERIHLYT